MYPKTSKIAQIALWCVIALIIIIMAMMLPPFRGAEPGVTCEQWRKMTTGDYRVVYHSQACTGYNMPDFASWVVYLCPPWAVVLNDEGEIEPILELCVLDGINMRGY